MSSHTPVATSSVTNHKAKLSLDLGSQLIAACAMHRGPLVGRMRSILMARLLRVISLALSLTRCVRIALDSMLHVLQAYGIFVLQVYYRLLWTIIQVSVLPASACGTYN